MITLGVLSLTFREAGLVRTPLLTAAILNVCSNWAKYTAVACNTHTAR